LTATVRGRLGRDPHFNYRTWSGKMNTTATETSSERKVRAAFQQSRWLLMAYGVVLVVLGCLAIAAPGIGTIAVDILVGWLFLIAGIAGVVAIFSTRSVGAFLWTLLTAALSILVGVLLIWKPIEGAISLTIVLTAFFIVEGIVQIIASLSNRDAMPGTWGWMLASGIADLILATIIIAAWPTSAAWTLGLLVGINLITTGVAVFVPAAAAGEGLRQN
jgi:uncharacterized membrane protein HdeD (DUF308 family)